MNAYDDVRHVMSEIERFLQELSNRVIDDDPEMRAVLREAKKKGDSRADDA